VHSQTPQNSVVIGAIDSIYSTILNEKRAIWVHVPHRGINSIFGAKEKYPVIYLLDGDAHFYSVVGMMHQLSQINGNTICPEMIVVGILNNDRTRDLTPSHMTPTAEFDSNFVGTSGGGKDFMAFIEKELIPYVDSLYPTAPYRMLIGHSLGGLMVIYSLFNNSELFNSYLAIDPSLWWDNQMLLKQADEKLANKNLDRKKLYLVAANTMSPKMDTLQVKEDTTQSTEHIRSILYFAEILKRASNCDLLWNWKYYNEEDHGSVPLIATYDALHFFFDFYKLPSYEILLDSLVQTDSLLVDYFINVSKNMRYQVLPPEPLVNSLGYIFLRDNKFSKSFPLFEMNIKNYPESFNVYDSMGDYYDAAGDKQKAIEYYEKALVIREFPESRKKLERLKSME
jgi:predicted alpha/beta superfamily hydrolase